MVLLPSSPLSFCQDKFSLTDSCSDIAPSWSIVKSILGTVSKSPDKLIDQLETISVTFHDSAQTDFIFLRDFLRDILDVERFFGVTWPKCVELALEMPTLFPKGSLSPLSVEHPSRKYSPRQVACLVIHQFLCTFERPPWMQDDASPDFHIWYGGTQPHPKAVHAYLYSLFTYFDRITSFPPMNESSITYKLHSSSSPPVVPASTPFVPLTIHEVPSSGMLVSLLGLPSGACVISSNKFIGFGRTGTQEEMHVGCTPEACPVVLLTPPLGNEQVMVVQGVKSMVEMEGYGRDASLRTVVQIDQWDWSRRTMLFMDALELDSYDTFDGQYIPDVLPGNVDRELTKAFTAFNSGSPDGRYLEVVTGLWGCRAFGGNPEIKTVIQWCAASIAGVPLKFVCETVMETSSLYPIDTTDHCFVQTQVDFLTRLGEFSRAAEKNGWTVNNVLQILRDLTPDDEASRSTLQHITRVINQM
jgi:poly(ADP-ribose) glycohydrolase